MSLVNNFRQSSAHSGNCTLVAQSIARQLEQSSYSGLRRLKLSYDQGTLTLQGRLPTFYLKQLAISIACDEPDVENVVDLIEIAEPAQV